METTQEEMNQFTTILGIRFFSGAVEEVAARAADGGLILAPSGPGLATLGQDRLYQEAVENCDIALPDSGFMTLLWKLFKRGSLKRLSGLKFLAHLILHDEAFRAEENRFWIMPSEDEGEAYCAWLQENGISVSPSECYTAPYYDPGEIEDDALVALLLERRPRYIIVNLGGGVHCQPGRRGAGNPGLLFAAISSLSAGYYLHRGGHRIPQWPASQDSPLGRSFLPWLVAALLKNARQLYPSILQCLTAPPAPLPLWEKESSRFSGAFGVKSPQ